MPYTNLTALPPPPLGKKGWPWTEESTPLPPTTPDVKPWPKISIVTPSFNQGQFIEETIRSVLLQNYPNLEYIIMDGGSTDNSVEIIKKYEPWLTYWVSEKDKGQYHAINKGFSYTTGDLMLWINSDDILIDGSLEAIGSIFRKFYGKVQWITGIPAYANQHGRIYKIFPTFGYNRKLIKYGCYDGRAINWIMQECTIWTRDLWEISGANLNESLDYAADFELWCRFADYAELYLVTMLFGCNRQHENQKTASSIDYCREVDRIISSDYKKNIVNHFFRISIVRKLTRAYYFSTRYKNHIHYDARSSEWKIS